jgi:signal transduction histidine kinase
MAQLQNSFAAMQRAIMSKMGSIGQTASEIEKYNVQQVEKVQQAEEAIQQKNQFISHVLNQVRRPLDVIKGGAKAMLNGRFGGLPDNELAAIADKMKYNAVSLDRMVLMLYDSSETEAADKSKYLAKKPVACNKEARECINFIHEQFPHTNMRLETEVPDQLQVNTNHLYLMLTLRELLYNAAKYSDGQHIVIRIKLLTGAVRFIVEDVGPGLPDDVSLDLVFKPFAKVDNLSEGLGLGLPLCKRHIDNIGGQFIHDKDYKGGCRFSIDIPLSA